MAAAAPDWHSEHNSSSNAEWEAQRERITELYKTRPLKEVARIMRTEHGFNASERMYKTRIQRWGIARNIKEAELRSMLRTLLQRNPSGKATEFSLRNKTISTQDLDRYLRRSRRRSRLDLALQEEAAHSPLTAVRHVQYYTPPASPLRQPDIYEFPNRAIQTIETYISGSFQSGSWALDSESDCITSKPKEAGEYMDHMVQARILLSRKDFQGSNRALAAASATISDVVKADDPETLPTVIFAFQQLRRVYHPYMLEIGLLMFKQFRDMSLLRRGPRHPLSQFYTFMLQADREQFTDILQWTAQKYLDGIQTNLGEMHSLSIEMKGSLLEAFVATTPAGALEAVRQLSSWQLQAREKLGPLDWRLFDLDLAITTFCKRAGDNAACLAHMHEALPRLDAASLPFLSDGFYRWHFNRELALASRDSEDLGQAEFYFRKAAGVGVETWGPDHPNVARTLLNLEDLYERTGRLERAAEIRRRRLEGWEQAGDPFV